MTSDFKWGILVVDCVRKLRDADGAPLGFVDWEVIPPFDGSPQGIFVWFICDTIAAKLRFRERAAANMTERLRALAVEGGFPSEAATTLRSDVTSAEEIKAGGGRFFFFR
jgi:hypothetical protein